MGYRTHFTGFIGGPEEFVSEFENWANANPSFGKYGAMTEGFLDGYFGDDMSWYDWQEDVAELSAKFPHVLFGLTGEGEEAGDVWKAWARNGKVVVARAELVFPEVDLDAELPGPDLAAALEEKRQRKRAEIDREIARLEAQKAAL